jgi:hypothetical protein
VGINNLGISRVIYSGVVKNREAFIFPGHGLRVEPERLGFFELLKKGMGRFFSR